MIFGRNRLWKADVDYFRGTRHAGVTLFIYGWSATFSVRLGPLYGMIATEPKAWSSATFSIPHLRLFGRRPQSPLTVDLCPDQIAFGWMDERNSILIMIGMIDITWRYRRWFK